MGCFAVRAEQSKKEQKKQQFLRGEYITSTIVKEAASYGGDVSSLVPKGVVGMLRKKYRRGRRFCSGT
jgi:hypothetical protein